MAAPEAAAAPFRTFPVCPLYGGMSDARIARANDLGGTDNITVVLAACPAS
jgi:hypothetical protein